MQKITPFIWFDSCAEDAVKFYTSIFKNSKTKETARYTSSLEGTSGKKAGSVMTINFTLNGQQFTALNGGPYYKLSPAVSLFVTCKSEKELLEIWKKLAYNAKILMELDECPFAKKYGWLQDKFGVSWQIILGDKSQHINPFVMFIGKYQKKAKDAIKFYTSVFKNAKIKKIELHGAGETESKGLVKHAIFTLAGQEFMALDSSIKHPFEITGGISFVINCKNQKEVDYYSSKLSNGGKLQRCGWVTDKYGVVWQVSPVELQKMMLDKNEKRKERVTSAMLQMVRLDVKKLKEAYADR